jgi:hypothetical protein
MVAPISLLLAVGSSPPGLRNRVTGPFVKTLPQKLRTGPAEMYPFPFPTLLLHRCDPAVSLHFVGTAITIPLRAKGSLQARASTAPAPANDSKMKKSGCTTADSSIFPSSSALPSSKLRISSSIGRFERVRDGHLSLIAKTVRTTYCGTDCRHPF